MNTQVATKENPFLRLETYRTLSLGTIKSFFENSLSGAMLWAVKNSWRNSIKSGFFATDFSKYGTLYGAFAGAGSSAVNSSIAITLAWSALPQMSDFLLAKVGLSYEKNKEYESIVDLLERAASDYNLESLETDTKANGEIEEQKTVEDKNIKTPAPQEPLSYKQVIEKFKKGEGNQLTLDIIEKIWKEDQYGRKLSDNLLKEIFEYNQLKANVEKNSNLYGIDIKFFAGSVVKFSIVALSAIASYHYPVAYFTVTTATAALLAVKYVSDLNSDEITSSGKLGYSLIQGFVAIGVREVIQNIAFLYIAPTALNAVAICCASGAVFALIKNHAAMYSWGQQVLNDMKEGSYFKIPTSEKVSAYKNLQDANIGERMFISGLCTWVYSREEFSELAKYMAGGVVSAIPFVANFKDTLMVAFLCGTIESLFEFICDLKDQSHDVELKAPDGLAIGS